MSQEFKPIFDYLDTMKADLKAEIVADLTPRFDQLQTSVDNLASQVYY